MLGNLTPEEIDAILLKHATGHLACTNGTTPYIVPLAYAFHGAYLVAHSKEGMKIDMMRNNPSVCFQVDEIDDLTNWRSVIVWGTYEEVTNTKERYYMMKFLVSHLLQYHAGELAGVKEMTRTLNNQAEEHPVNRPVVYRIRIREKTGRFERRSTDRI